MHSAVRAITINIPPYPTMSVPPSMAAQVMRTRALQCSFSSVFHLRRAGMDQHDADFVENVFVATVGVPVAILGATGVWLAFTKNDDADAVGAAAKGS